MATAYFAAGCFWGVESAFRRLDGVTDVACGYMNGHTENPTYPEVCTGRTGHAEAVAVTFDPAIISYDQLLDAFWQMHDPTQVNRQGPDIGTQYRSGIYTVDEEQARAAQAAKQALEASGRLTGPVATEIAPAEPFWRAEEYHQQYFAKRGLISGCHG